MNEQEKINQDIARIQEAEIGEGDAEQEFNTRLLKGRRENKGLSSVERDIRRYYKA
jgi:hypothetical protein